MTYGIEHDPISKLWLVVKYENGQREVLSRHVSEYAAQRALAELEAKQQDGSPALILAGLLATAIVTRRPRQARKPKQSREELLASQGKLQVAFQQEMGRLAKDLASGNITTQEWQRQMKRELKLLHVGSRVISVGGWDNVTSEQVARAMSTVEDQYAYLERWEQELQNTEITPEMSDKIARRASLYANASEATFDEGYYGAIGMPPLPAYPRDGSTDCLTNCKCSWVIRTIDENRGDWDCTWKMGNAEHCPQCRQRARVWSPLKIRGGVIVPYNRGGLFS